MNAEKKTAKDYKIPGAKPIWCPGCGQWGIFSALLKSFADLGIDKDGITIVSGIGCTSRLPFFSGTYGYHSLHGRALPTAVGLKVARPDLTVVVVGGDGDGLSIGGNHFIHAARRNPDITYIMSNNAVYGMTKGQLSPTSPYGMKSSTSPFGSIEYPLDPTAIALVSGATYVARGFPPRARELSSLITEGIAHPGFAFIEVITPCVTFNRAVGYQSVGISSTGLPEAHMEGDLPGAIELALDKGKTYFGRFYRTVKPTYHHRMNDLYGRRCEKTDDYLHLIKLRLLT